MTNHLCLKIHWHFYLFGVISELPWSLSTYVSIHLSHCLSKRALLFLGQVVDYVSLTFWKSCQSCLYVIYFQNMLLTFGPLLLKENTQGISWFSGSCQASWLSAYCSVLSSWPTPKKPAQGLWNHVYFPDYLNLGISVEQRLSLGH